MFSERNTKNKVKREILKKKKKNKLLKIKPTKQTSISKQVASINWLTFMGPQSLSVKPTTQNESVKNKTKYINKNSAAKMDVTKVLAIDCEMVSNLDNEDMLARISVVNFKLECIYDKFVKPQSKIGDFRTRFSGIREEDLQNGSDFNDVRSEVKEMLHNKILVGHALHNDFKVMKFGHHKQLIRDTSKYKPFLEVNDMKSPSLKKLAKVFLNENIQEGEHNSIEDAKTAMKLYKKFRKEWEVSLLSTKMKNQKEISSEPPE